MTEWYEILGLILSILGFLVVIGRGLWKLSSQLSSIDTRLGGIGTMLEKGEARMEEHDKIIRNHGERIATLEGKVE